MQLAVPSRAKYYKKTLQEQKILFYINSESTWAVLKSSFIGK